jgi:hypothetical protein
MLINAIGATGLIKHEGALARRFLAKLVVDVLPAAFVSVLGGFFLTQYQFTHSAAQRPTVQVAPASAEMMQLVRDEHTAIIDYLRAQTAAEKSRQAAEDAADVRAAAEARDAETQVALAPTVQAQVADAPTAPVAMPLPRPPAAAATKPAAPRVKTAATTVPPHAPMVIAQADQAGAVAAVLASAAAPAADADAPPAPKSLLTRTIEIKDHVVGATRNATWHVVSAIGGLPSWIASMGDRSGGDAAPSETSPASRPFTTTSS